MADIKAPELTGEIVTPKVTPDASKGIMPFKAKPELMEKVNFLKEKPSNWKELFLKRMGEILQKYKSVRVFLDICVRCGACTDKCHYYLSTGDPRNMPVHRQELMRSVYRKYFTTGGKFLGGLASGRELSDELLEEWLTYFYQCSECRRCSVFCPYGIDTAEITMAAREILDSLGLNSIPVIGLAKEFEEIHFAERDEPLRLPAGSEALKVSNTIGGSTNTRTVSFDWDVGSSSGNELA